MKNFLVVLGGISSVIIIFILFGTPGHHNARSSVEQSLVIEETHKATKARGESINKPISKPTVDYEHDQEERCKDWVYHRNRALRLGREGDREGSAEASRMMNRYYDDLRKIFTEQQITEAISRIEANGYRTGL